MKRLVQGACANLHMSYLICFNNIHRVSMSNARNVTIRYFIYSIIKMLILAQERRKNDKI